jgi:branched-chain amino acid transport system permease protein
VLGGIAATLVALAFNVINSGLGETYLLIAVASMVVGGFGSIIGILLGGLFIGVSSAYATGFIDSSYRDLVVFVLLLGFLVIKPSGLIRTTNDLDRV